VGLMLGISVTKSVFGIDLQTTFLEIINHPSEYPQGVLALKLNQGLISIAIFIVPAFLFSRAINQNPVHFLHLNHKTRFYNYLFIIILIISAIPVSSWLLTFNQNLHFPENLKEFEGYLREDEAFSKLQSELFVKANGVGQLVLNLVIVAVIPAIAEEIFFRGCLQNFVRMCFYNLHVSVIFTAIIFSAIHGDYFGFLPRFMFGMVLGYAFAYSGNIWVPVFGHFLNNGITVLAFYISEKHPEIPYFKNEYNFPIYLTGIAAFGVLIILFAMSKLRFNQIFIKHTND
jgi:hypothetical protein